MKNLYLILAVVLVISIFGFSSEIFAADNIILDPPLGQFVTGTTSTIQFRAAPPVDTIDGIEIALGFVGGTITNVTITDNTEPYFGTCVDGDESIIFTANTICFAEAFTPPLTQNQLIFTATILWGDPGVATIMHTGSFYASYLTSQQFDLVGEAGSYEIVLEIVPTNTPGVGASITPTGALPPTGFIDENFNLIIGIGLVVMGIIVYRYSGGKYFSNQLNNED